MSRWREASGTSTTLTFHKEQMNDVLKSLVAWDRGGGQVRNVAYDAPEELRPRRAMYIREHRFRPMFILSLKINMA